ncbi:ArsR/SmtB family transcription factor [Halovenus rubra]|uniref:ArsR/SmtB family transcription factor n=2 Tax=Halovenus rubra TaxID=869890 RepID=A0ACC7E057_9EURY|nr:winged helix-turn-helix domain-containing protein [Halovenus rubra]
MTGGPASDDSLLPPGSSVDSATELHPTPAAAFQQLGNKARVDILRLLTADGPCSFSTLFEASDSDTSAGFAYHLRQLDDRFVRQRADERWELTAAGREAARTVVSGEFTRGVDHDAVTLSEPCPLCHEGALTLSVSRSTAEVACSGCGESVMRLSFPPSGHIRDEDDLPGALDTYHRNRIRTFVDGVCPDCGGSVETSPELVGSDGANGDPLTAQLACSCTRCPASFDCPATLSVLDHPAVVSFYDDHGQNITERPVWNAGPEWRERVLSTEPWCLLVQTQLDDEVLELFIGGDGAVHEHRRRSEDASAPADATDVPTESGERGDDAAA